MSRESAELEQLLEDVRCVHRKLRNSRLRKKDLLLPSDQALKHAAHLEKWIDDMVFVSSTRSLGRRVRS